MLPKQNIFPMTFHTIVSWSKGKASVTPGLEMQYCWMSSNKMWEK